MTRNPLTPEQVSDALRAVPGWELASPAWLERRWELADFDAAMAFIEAVADVARRLDHHPDLYNVYNRVTLRLQTHDAGGLTELDFAFARAINSLGR